MNSWLDEFRNSKFDSIEEADHFFEKYGAGNAIQLKDKPYERFWQYFNLLLSLQREDRVKFIKMHKGTPYFFLAWSSFDMLEYERGFHYVVAGLYEDKNNMPQKGWNEHNVSEFITMLKPEKVPAKRNIDLFREIITNDINRFNNTGMKGNISFEEFITKYVIQSIDNDMESINIIIGMYIFLLDAHFIKDGLLISSGHGRSIQAILSNLFKGSIVFESLLRQLYSDNLPAGISTLGNILNLQVFKSRYGDIKSNANSLAEVIQVISDLKANAQQCALTACSKLRNTTAHNLIWDDIFNDIANYENLCYEVMNALYILIYDNFF